MKTYKTQRTKTCLWHNMCRYWETNTRKIKPNIEKYIREQQLKYLLSTKYALRLETNTRKIKSNIDKYI